ncbi:hypothetical protein ACWT_6036 [Actinoplanes sp. SE50]|nr:hypothetical protein ACPL_6168 [Actinoplanes sp. SE50/110]ATO85451.1 hypothetical protein ACWT_6036 [Actinoplanes sp. SE50]SLM02863.1 hypothetical protein ACSP50_6148 [Actinoplanes sp. SE50/110]
MARAFQAYHSIGEAYTILCERAAVHGNSLAIEAEDVVRRW